MIVLILLMTALTGLLSGYWQKYEDQLHAETLGLPENRIRIQVPSCSPQQLKAVIEDLHARYQCAFVREDIMEENGRTVTVRSVSQQELFSNIPLQQGRIPQNESQFIATYETGDPRQNGIIPDLFDDDPRQFRFLEDYWNQFPENAGGSYYLCCPPNDQDQALETLAAALDTTVDQLGQVNSYKQYDPGPVKIIAAGIVLLGLLFALLCLFYPVNQIKTIGVYKLLGFSGAEIWTRLLWPVFGSGLAGVILVMIGQWIVVKNRTAVYMFQSFAVQMIVLCAGIVLSGASLLIIRQYTLSAILKGNHHGRLVYWASLGLKLAVFVSFALLAPVLVSLMHTIWYQVQAAHAYEQAAEELTISQYDFVDDEFQQKLNGNDVLNEKMSRFFEQIEQTADARYVYPVLYDGSYFHGIQKSVPEDFDPIAAMYVNENELDLYASWFDEPVSTYFSGSGLSVLVPDTMDQKRIEKTIEAVSYPWTAAQKEISLSLHTYRGKERPVFTQNAFLIDRGHGFVNDPVFVCLDHTVPEAWIGMDSQALSNPIRVSDTKRNRKAIEAALKENGLARNAVRFASVYDAVFRSTMEAMKTSTFVIMGAVGFLFFVDLLASAYLMQIVLLIRRKEIFVRKILGHSFMSRYRTEWIHMILIVLSGTAIVMRNVPSMNAFAVYGLLVLLDLFMMYGMIRRQENKALSLLLKGEQ